MSLEILSLKFDGIISKYRDEINHGLSKIYLKGPKSLVQPIQYVLEGSGKRLRPLLSIFTAESCGGTKKDVFSAALAVEVLHNFTLVHDDIMDQDSIRHGKKTVHHKWDNGVAILTGDAMLSLALKLLNQNHDLSYRQMKIFVDALLAVCEGQALDKEYETRNSISIDEYINMIDLKTGYMLGLSAELGAISAEKNMSICKNLRDYGCLVGRAFQIQDDYLELFSNSSNMGKSLKSDIVLGKKTFLMIQALEKDNDEINMALELVKKDFNLGIKKIRIFMDSKGIKKNTEFEIENILHQANEKIKHLPIDKDKILYFSKLIKNRGN